MQHSFKAGYSISYKFIDRGVLETVGPTGAAFLAFKASSAINGMQTKHVYHYTLIILISGAFYFILQQMSLIIDFIIDPCLMLMVAVSTIFFVLPYPELNGSTPEAENDK